MNDNIEPMPAIAHAPGPWDYDMDYIVAPDPNGVHPDIYIAEIAHIDDEGRIATPEQQDANRRLIAAAPDLLELANQIVLAKDGDESVPVDLYYAAARIIARTSVEEGICP